MGVPTCLQNNILVELESKFQEELVSDGGMKFYKDTTFRPEWNTTISGKVVSVPIKLTEGNGSNHSLDFDRPNIHQIIKPGDELVFNYLVIMNRKMTDNAGEIFTRDTPTNPFTTVWSNPNGQQIVRVYLMNDRYEIGLFDTGTKIWVDRVKGALYDVENFMAKYMPTENYGFNYGNLLPYDGKDYWLVDYTNAIAVKRAEGIFDMIGDFVLIEPIREPRRDTYQGIIEVHNLEQETDYKAIGKILSIGPPLKGQPKLSVKINDTICTDIRYVEKYEIDRRDYWVVRQKYIYGKQSVTNDTTGNT